jgi:hypothetical protein
MTPQSVDGAQAFPLHDHATTYDTIGSVCCRHFAGFKIYWMKEETHKIKNLTVHHLPSFINIYLSFISQLEKRRRLQLLFPKCLKLS